MDVQTTRFGTVEVDDARVITFPAGLLGFASHHQFVLLQPDDEGVFFWLQSTESPDLAFIITDPTLWVKEYVVPIRREQMDELKLASTDDSQVFVIVNKYGRALTANLQGPLVVNVKKRQAMQLVLADKRWTTRNELIKLPEPAEAVPA